MLEVLPHVNELRDKEDKVSHMSFRFNESASPPERHRAFRRDGRQRDLGICFFDSLGCFATGSSKLSAAFNHIR